MSERNLIFLGLVLLKRHQSPYLVNICKDRAILEWCAELRPMPHRKVVKLFLLLIKSIMPDFFNFAVTRSFASDNMTFTPRLCKSLLSLPAYGVR